MTAWFGTALGRDGNQAPFAPRSGTKLEGGLPADCGQNNDPASGQAAHLTGATRGQADRAPPGSSTQFNVTMWSRGRPRRTRRHEPSREYPGTVKPAFANPSATSGM